MNKQLMIFQMRAFQRLFKSLTSSLNILKAQRFKYFRCVLRLLSTGIVSSHISWWFPNTPENAFCVSWFILAKVPDIFEAANR